jgi:cobalamin biosynthesis Mg chelatase CobN
MEVITDRPIYSYLNEEEKALKKKQKQDKAAKRKETLDTVLQNDFTKSVVGAVTGVGAEKIQRWAGTGTGTQTISGANPLNVSIQTEADRQRESETLAQQQKERSRKMIRNVVIGVVAVAVLGTVTYFVMKSRKGKKATAKK